MKKIAFFVQHMLCGGVENSLIALSKELKSFGNEVTIYVISETGDFMNQIPDGVIHKKIPLPQKIENALPIGGTKISIRKNISQHHYIRAAINLKNHIFGKSGFAELNVDFDSIPILAEEYDIAVNFHIHSPFLVRYLSEKVKAKKKVSWIHNDFTTTNYDIRKLEKYLVCCDLFYGVSQKIVSEFIEIFPEYKDRTYIMHNIIPVNEILEKGKKKAPEFEIINKDFLKLLSVGRLENQKGFDITIDICKELVDKKYKFKWFILGEGSEKKSLKKKIKRLGLKNTIFLLGSKMNPYPYFKNCDIYVQTSRHEGWGIAVQEAKVFRKPIVCTDFAGAKEQLIDGVTGYITSFDKNDITEKIEILMSSYGKREKFRVNLSQQQNIEKQDILKIF